MNDIHVSIAEDSGEIYINAYHKYYCYLRRVRAFLKAS